MKNILRLDVDAYGIRILSPHRFLSFIMAVQQIREEPDGIGIGPREILALKSRYVDQKSLIRVAEDLGWVTPERARQILKRILRKLRHPRQRNRFREFFFIGDAPDYSGMFKELDFESHTKRMSQWP